jgi:hypothetical protein
MTSTTSVASWPPIARSSIGMSRAAHFYGYNRPPRLHQKLSRDVLATQVGALRSVASNPYVVPQCDVDSVVPDMCRGFNSQRARAGVFVGEEANQRCACAGIFDAAERLDCGVARAGVFVGEQANEWCNEALAALCSVMAASAAPGSP